MLMPAMVFGLETVIMLPKKMEKLMQNLYFRFLPILGVNRHITKGWRMLPERYHGLGLPNFVVLYFAGSSSSYSANLALRTPPEKCSPKRTRPSLWKLVCTTTF